jgi:hypothetical protein
VVVGVAVVPLWFVALVSVVVLSSSSRARASSGGGVMRCSGGRVMRISHHFTVLFGHLCDGIAF